MGLGSPDPVDLASPAPLEIEIRVERGLARRPSARSRVTGAALTDPCADSRDWILTPRAPRLREVRVVGNRDPGLAIRFAPVNARYWLRVTHAGATVLQVRFVVRRFRFKEFGTRTLVTRLYAYSDRAFAQTRCRAARKVRRLLGPEDLFRCGRVRRARPRANRLRTTAVVRQTAPERLVGLDVSRRAAPPA